jgi:phage anti-repressor protein
MELSTVLTSEFTDDEKEMFTQNFTSYLKHDQYKDFVIDFDDVYEWVGFSLKGHAKRLLEKCFVKERDYMIFAPKGKNYTDTSASPNVGRIKETIMLTPFAFKDFCMRASTERGHKIRMYYLHLEEIINKQVSDQMKLEFENYKITTQNKIKALEDKFKGRKKTNYKLGDTVYILMERDGKEVRYKVGSSRNMNERQAGYYCHSTSNKIVYTRMCKDCKRLEDAMHFRFTDKRYMDREDWFLVSFEALRNSLDYLQVGLDGEASTFTIDEEAISVALEAASNDDPNTDPEPEPSTDGVDDSTDGMSEAQDGGGLEPDEDPENEPATSEPLPPPTPTNFARFLEECYEKDPNSKACWVEIGARCRLWLRSTQLFKEELAAFLKANGYKETYIFDTETKTNYTAYAGLKMKPLPPFKVSKSSSEIERFVFDTCVPNATGRVTCKDLASAYETWKKVTTAALIPSQI